MLPPVFAAGASEQQALLAKQARAASAIPARAPHAPFFGLTLLSCERGDIRQSPNGLRIHSAQGVREQAVSVQRSPRELVLDAWQAAIAGARPALHDVRWGLANLEICVAALASSRSGREVLLHEQVPLPE